MVVHCGASWRRGNSGEEVRHEVGGGVRVVEEVHDDGWDLVKVAAVLEVGQRGAVHMEAHAGGGEPMPTDRSGGHCNRSTSRGCTVRGEGPRGGDDGPGRWWLSAMSRPRRGKKLGVAVV
jgi:hypothetical protein